MAVTEQNYRDIADRVYAVEDGKEAHTIIKNDTFKSGGNQFQVLKVEDNTTNGMQAMAVAPVDANGNVDTSQVVIAYAGTNSADGKDLDTDLQSIGGGSKKLVSGSDMSAEGLTIADSQFKTALKFFKQVEKDVKQSHPNAVITTTGHSLGGSLSMYVALKRGYASVTYNGPDIHNMLSKKEIAYMQTHKGQFRNYRNRYDVIGNVTGNETQTAIYVNATDGIYNPLHATSVYHSLSNWQFNRKGQLINLDGKVASSYLSGMSAYYSLKTEREKHGLTSNEEFFLDSTQATVIATGLVKAAETVKDEVEAAKKRAVEEAEELYQSTKTAPFGITELSVAEIQAAYAEAGVTYDSIVGKTERHFDKKVSKAKKLVTAYSDLQGKIQAGVNDAFAKDASLAGKFQEWSAN